MSSLEGSNRPSLPEMVAGQIKSKIDSGEYAGRLPSASQLAKDHGVSRVTLMNGLKQLSSEGAIVIRQGSGTYVAGTPPVRRRHLETFDPIGEEPRTDIAQYPEGSPMSFSDIYIGLRLFTWTKQRLREIEYTESPSLDNLQRLEAAAGRVTILDKIAEGVGKEPENPLLRVGLITTFKQEVDTIRSYPTLGDALVAIGETGIDTSR